LFIVGKWSLLAEMAEEIYLAFRQWTCFNPCFGLSGGLAVVTPKFPIMKGAKLAEEAEKKAKEHKIKLENIEIKKNAITLFDQPLNWEHEFPVVKHYKNRILQFLTVSEGLPAGFLQKIYSFYDNYTEQTKKDKNPRWRWMIAYDFSRLKGRVKSTEVKDFLEELKQNIFTDKFGDKPIISNYPFIELITIASRWAELEIKS
jgi:CRISPR-associated protein Csm1